MGLPEIHIQAELVARFPTQNLVGELIDFGGYRLNDVDEAEIADGYRSGDDALSAGGGQQGDIVPVTLILVGAAQVKDPVIGVVLVLRIADILLDGDHARVYRSERPFMRMVDDNQVVVFFPVG